jgi:hypothetical protein
MKAGQDDFSITFNRRDFSGPILTAVELSVEKLSWSAFGGPHRAVFSAMRSTLGRRPLFERGGALQNLLELASLLRCGVMVRDRENTPVWWGFVEEVTVYLQGVQLRVSLEGLYNQVRVQYTFLSPDNKLADQLETSPAVDSQSQREFGIREKVIHRRDLDDAFAVTLRDTFLSLHAWPTSELSQRAQGDDLHAQVRCSGWFQTLAWRNYENPEGFYANTSPGPGVFPLGDSTAHRTIAQSFTPGADVYLKVAYFRLRKEGSPTAALTAQVRSTSSGVPGTILAVSDSLPASSVPGTKYAWLRFTFDPPYDLSSGQRYWIALDPGGVDAAHYFYIKTDENMNYRQEGHCGRYYDQASGTWPLIPSITAPGSQPDLVFRLVCVSDTGSQLAALAGAGGQFFEKIKTLSTGIQTSPYRMKGLDCLAEIKALLKLGTCNQRLMLAAVTPERHLRFYEQPASEEEDLYMDHQSRFFTQQYVPIPPYLPPVGRYVHLAATTRVRLPWDRNRLPACFIAYAEYFPRTGRVRVRKQV